MLRSLSLPLSAVLLLGVSEFVSARWQAGGASAAERGIYRESLFYMTPGQEVSVQNLPIDERQVGFLTYDRGRRLAVLDRAESRGMELLYLEYDGNSPRFFFDLFNHPPERCMASTGAEVTERYPKEMVEVEGHPCQLEGMKIRVPGSEDGERYIFKLVWLHPDHPVDYGSAMHLKRVQAALATVPPPPARLIMAGLHGFDSPEEARAFFEAHTLENLHLGES